MIWWRWVRSFLYARLSSFDRTMLIVLSVWSRWWRWGYSSHQLEELMGRGSTVRAPSGINLLSDVCQHLVSHKQWTRLRLVQSRSGEWKSKCKDCAEEKASPLRPFEEVLAEHQSTCHFSLLSLRPNYLNVLILTCWNCACLCEMPTPEGTCTRWGLERCYKNRLKPKEHTYLIPFTTQSLVMVACNHKLTSSCLQLHKTYFVLDKPS